MSAPRHLRVVFVALHPSGDGSLDPNRFPNFGARRVEAALRSSDLDAEVSFVESVGESVERIAERVVAAAPDVLAVSAYMWSLPRLLGVVGLVAAALPECTVVLGGPQAHPNVLRQEAFRDAASAVAAVVLEEPETTFVAALRALSLGSALSEVPGLALPERAGDDDGTRRWRSTGSAPARIDLNDLPSPWQLGLMPAGAYGYLERFRGCPLSCTFCEWGRLEDPKAILTQERIEAELEAFGRGGAGGVLLVDAGLNMHAEAFRLFAAAEQNVGLLRRVPFVAEVYPRKVDDTLLRFLGDQKAPHVGLGLQSFNAAALEAVDRRFVRDDFVPLVHRLAEVAAVSVEIILGLPGDSPEGFAMTLERVLDLPCRVRIYPCVVLPTALMQRDGADQLDFDPVTSIMRSAPGWSAGEIRRWSDALDGWAVAAGGVADPYWWEIPHPSRRRPSGSRAPLPLAS